VLTKLPKAQSDPNCVYRCITCGSRPPWGRLWACPRSKSDERSKAIVNISYITQMWRRGPDELCQVGVPPALLIVPILALIGSRIFIQPRVTNGCTLVTLHCMPTIQCSVLLRLYTCTASNCQAIGSSQQFASDTPSEQSMFFQNFANLCQRMLNCRFQYACVYGQFSSNLMYHSVAKFVEIP
jgi:hypothetical protein